MAIQIGARPDAGFDDPIGMLKDCHRRIERFLDILCVVVERAPGRSLSDEETAAVHAALHYFRVGGQRHNADEEQSLFPRIRAHGSTEEIGDIGGLEHDHRTADELHQRVDSLYSAWIANDGLSSEQHAELATATAHLKKLYAQHIDLEERIVFPRAKQMLQPDAIAEIGREFRNRRS
ncbi:MAG TPA: hemerythrin domain-containing protein [Terracidiphilus sp.]|jgi:hemerythrin-like domain-containing protein|nr:hemerythrin domain-containing protein [Terracidiphilus sp.]